MALRAKDAMALAAAWDPLAPTSPDGIQRFTGKPLEGPRPHDDIDRFLEELNALCEHHDLTIDVGPDGDCRVEDRNTRTWERQDHGDDVSNTYECDR